MLWRSLLQNDGASKASHFHPSLARVIDLSYEKPLETILKTEILIVGLQVEL